MAYARLNKHRPGPSVKMGKLGPREQPDFTHCSFVRMTSYRNREAERMKATRLAERIVVIPQCEDRHQEAVRRLEAAGKVTRDGNCIRPAATEVADGQAGRQAVPHEA